MARKKRKVQSYSFLVVPDNKGEPRGIKLSAWSTRALLAGVLIVAVLVIAGAATYWKVASVALDYRRLQEENFELRNSLKQVENIRVDLAKMQKFNSQIRSSLSGYLKVENLESQDTTGIDELDFETMQPGQVRTIFNSIPSLMPVEGFITRGFQITNLTMEPHFGLDIAAANGTPIRAPANGIVVFEGWTSESGYVLVVQHGYGYLTVYKHNQRNLAGMLEKITKGEVIAYLGDTGEISSGAHLHYEVWLNGKPLDPLKYVNVSAQQLIERNE